MARYYVERQVAAQLRNRVETLADYAEVARLNFIGTSGRMIAPLVEHGEISRALEVKNNNAQFNCDEASIEVFNDVASPLSAFSVFSLRSCSLSSAKGRRSVERSCRQSGRNLEEDDYD